MGRIDDAILSLNNLENGTERALQLAGLLSTLFKIKGVILVATDQVAFDSYANTVSETPAVDLAALIGELTPRAILDIMRGQLRATGSLYHWTVAGIPVRFLHDTPIAYRDLCRDFTTDHGVVKLVPVEELTADYILSAFYPEPNFESQQRAHQLLINGLTEVFHMDWTVLHTLCHRPEYRVGEELAQMRLAAKKEADAAGTMRDHVGETSTLPRIIKPEELAALADKPPVTATPAPEVAGPFS